jgi:transposase
MSMKGWRGWPGAATAARNGGIFDAAQADAVAERLRHPPDPVELAEPAEPVVAAAPAAATAPPSPVAVPQRCWTLQRLQATFPWLAHYRTLSGVWRAVRRAGQRLRRGRPRQFSPDPAYVAKEAHLLTVLRQVAASGGTAVAVFVDEFTYHHWPLPGRTWAPGQGPPPVAERAAPGERQRRIVAGLDACTGRVVARQANSIRSATFIAFLRQLARAYPTARKLYVILDNWPVHTNPKVTAAVAKLERLELVALPTYAPWLNPIEKLWDWLKAAELRQHTLAGRWEALQARVTAFLARFAEGSEALLRRVGLRGPGTLAQALVPPPPITDLERQT